MGNISQKASIQERAATKTLGRQGFPHVLAAAASSAPTEAPASVSTFLDGGIEEWQRHGFRGVS